MECFGPLTTVNGKIWPFSEVEPATYRLRALNGANASTFRLLLVDEDGEPVLDRIRQIGSDDGLLLDAVSLPAAGLVLGPPSAPIFWSTFRTWRPAAGSAWSTLQSHPSTVPRSTPTPAILI